MISIVADIRDGAAIIGQRRWHVLEAREGCDFSVWRQLERDGFEVCRPVDVVRYTRRVRVGGVVQAKRFERKLPRFGRYLFVHAALSAGLRAAFENDPDVVGFLRAAGSEAPAVVREDLIAFYREARQSAATDAGFMVGDRVRIVMGPATGVIGVVRETLRASVMLTVGESGGAWAGKLLAPVEHLELVERSKAGAKGIASGGAVRRRV